MQPTDRPQDRNISAFMTLGKLAPGDRAMSREPKKKQLQRVQIVAREHPHFEEYGRFTGKIVTLFGKPMAEVTLEHCWHGGDACFVSKGDVQFVAERKADV